MINTNILIISCDQLSAKALRHWGGEARAPAIDSLAVAGTRFSHAYTTCPLCQPARASFWTGMYPHDTGVDSNGRNCPVPSVPDTSPTIGSSFADAGYRAVHFGKRHDAGSLRGFEVVPVEEDANLRPEHPAWPVNYDSRRDSDTRTKLASFLSRYADSQPFIAVADLNNPHDICSWIGNFRDNQELISPEGELPPLPANLYHSEEQFRKLPIPVQYICCAHRRQAQIAAWDENRIRHYLRAYYHYIERVDRDISAILQALADGGHTDNTLIVLMADHGDSMCGRWMATKHTSFYDETTRVPFIFIGPDIHGGGRKVDAPVSLVDLFPTLLDYAGIARPEGLRGVSLLPALQGKPCPELDERQYVISEWYSEWGFTIEPGRMIRTPRYKYTHYIEGNGEELYDLEIDPLEMNNLAFEPSADILPVLKEHRRLLKEYAESSGDPYVTQQPRVEKRWRSHQPGYRNHRGSAAPEDRHNPANTASSGHPGNPKESVN